LFELYGGQDPRHVATYSPSEVARYLRVPASTLRAWVFGTRYQTKRGAKPFEPVIQRPKPKERLLSFTNLIELHVLNAIRKVHNVPLVQVRQGLNYIKDLYSMEHPLASQKLYTDGLDLFVEHLGKFVNASRHGQLAIPEIVQVYLQRIEWDEEGLAARLYPFTRFNESSEPTWIVIDPSVSFGQPAVVDSGVPTAILAQRYAAGESIDELASDYECDRLKIEEAIRYELALAA